MKERPILFSGAMVRAILDGTKTQTRRVVKPQPQYICTDWTADAEIGDIVMYRQWPHRLMQSHGRDKAAAGELTPTRIYCPYGQPGDRLWVRETWAEGVRTTLYRATDGDMLYWKPSIHMPRSRSRITLEITDVRVERLHRIGEESAKAEGVAPKPVVSVSRGESYLSYSEAFADIWDSINAKRGYGWTVNPWVWVISFARVQP